MNKHTPGPWKTCKIYFRWKVLAPLLEPGAELDEHYVLADNIREEEDANLMAAAPDLLGTLKLVLEELNLGGNANHLKAIVSESIAKAEGRESK